MSYSNLCRVDRNSTGFRFETVTILAETNISGADKKVQATIELAICTIHDKNKNVRKLLGIAKQVLNICVTLTIHILHANHIYDRSGFYIC